MGGVGSSDSETMDNSGEIAAGMGVAAGYGDSTERLIDLSSAGRALEVALLVIELGVADDGGNAASVEEDHSDSSLDGKLGDPGGLIGTAG